MEAGTSAGLFSHSADGNCGTRCGRSTLLTCSQTDTQAVCSHHTAGVPSAGLKPPGGFWWDIMDWLFPRARPHWPELDPEVVHAALGPMPRHYGDPEGPRLAAQVARTLQHTILHNRILELLM